MKAYGKYERNGMLRAKRGNMEVFKRHFETFTIVGSMLATVACACMWINGKFNDVNEKFNYVNEKIADVNVRLTRIETIMFLKGMISSEMVTKAPEGK